MKIQHQISNRTAYDRYPNIFTACSALKPDCKNILSFGCSTGEEVFSLRNKYFKHAAIHGLDINSENIKKCKEKNKDKSILFFDYNDYNKLEKYDIIFCMSVLCRWTATQSVEDCSHIYNFKTYEEELSKINLLLNNSGLLVIYNSNFCFADTSLYNLYSPIKSNLISDSGFVKKFDKNNKASDRLYSECIFIKK